MFDRVYPRHAPRWLSLLLDVAVVSLYLLLDARDLWFKLRWVGPRDAFMFSTVETKYLPGSDAAPLQPTTTFSYADQTSQRASGWSSFLEKCETLTPLTEENETHGFHHVVGRNCMVGAVRAAELLLTSSIRVDSMAWTACELLYKHRKPPICHSPLVSQFRERYNLLNEVAIEPSSVELTNPAAGNTLQEAYAVKPGTETEAELIGLLEIISKSSPISAAVCVEGFILKGPGKYTSTIYGCGSPSFYRSALIGVDIPMLAQLQRDKGWLTSNSISMMGMKFLKRENRRSIFTIRNPVSGHDVKRVLEHLSLANCSSSGALYTLMILIDITLGVLNIFSVVEIARFVLWPLWKPLVASEYQTSSAQMTKMGYAVEDYARVIQVAYLW
ncbi:hypothetical protein PHMEG_00034074 [Phytophthora megakarya]|uniref:Transmembrane protein n=1 Tax=Phytophthora megakarya TaxID=4795 RepID=A0A225US53_9STRA|nr:hypothetical protein PHMEG_00034074 [Phytophthora megakarya]